MCVCVFAFTNICACLCLYNTYFYAFSVFESLFALVCVLPCSGMLSMVVWVGGAPILRVPPEPPPKVSLLAGEGTGLTQGDATGPGGGGRLSSPKRRRLALPAAGEL